MLYETNVTLHESGPFYLENYNKFILDKIKVNGTDRYKHKGSGISIFLHEQFTDATIEQMYCVSTPDIEILTVKFNKNNFLWSKIIIFVKNILKPPHFKIKLYVIFLIN